MFRNEILESLQAATGFANTLAAEPATSDFGQTVKMPGRRSTRSLSQIAGWRGGLEKVTTKILRRFRRETSNISSNKFVWMPPNLSIYIKY